MPSRNFSFNTISAGAYVDVFDASFTGLEIFERVQPCSYRGRPETLAIECLVAFKSLKLKAYGNARQPGWFTARHIEFAANFSAAFGKLRLSKRNGSTSLSFNPIDGTGIPIHYWKDPTGWNQILMNSVFIKWILAEHQDLIREEFVWRLNEAFIRIRP